MSRWKRRALSVALAVCLMFCQSVYAFAEGSEEAPSQVPAGYSESDMEESESFEQPIEPEPEEPAQPQAASPTDLPDPQEIGEPEAVTDEVELKAWIAQHSETGGTVYLADCVTITQDMGIYGISGEITVDTGSHGLVFDGGALPSSDIFITGEGVDMPVVKVLRTGGGSPWDTPWNNTLLELSITATGRDGMGGTALRIMAAEPKSISMDALYEQGVIRSYGKGAIGLWLDVPMEAWCYRVEVFGDNSVAVYAPTGADLYYCKLTADGNGAASAAGNDLLLDSCAAFPVPSDVQSINRRAMEASFSRLYLPLEQNGGLFGAIEMLNTPTVFLDGGDGILSRPFAVYWDMDAYYDIDTGVLGTTMVSGAVAPALYGLGVFDDVSIELTVEVRDPDLPCISQIAVRELDGKRYAVLNFWWAYDPTDASVILWRSDDEGQTWRDATRSPDISWSNDSVDFSYDTLAHSVWFQIEVIGAGESNIAVLDERDGVFMGGNGGDRTGTDREGAGPVGGDDDTPTGGQPDNGDGGTPDNGDKPSGGDDSTPTGSQPDNGDGSTSDNDDKPGGDNEGTPGNGGEPTDGGEPNSDEAGKDGDGEDIRYTQGDTDAKALTPAPADVPPLGAADENISAWKPVSAAALDPAARAKENPEADGEHPADEDADGIPLSAAGELLPLIDAPLIFDSEQSAPEPGFSASALVVFFVGVATLCIGALLILRSGWFWRWRHGKE
ncbi:MAG TPA: hypothetical protein VN421_11105 [Pseudoflavonifractor sp.]|nr:hypothetical protein [Pseudoflavonifractor sp.]